jgi:dihydroorotate dehydrogenase
MRRLETIGVGGIFSARHVAEFLGNGAASVQLATAAMLDPFTGIRIRREWLAGGFLAASTARE